MTVEIATLSARPLDVAAHHEAVLHTAAGAVASFTGAVRDHDPGATGEVVALDYSAHPLAAEIIAGIAAAVDRDYAEAGLRIAVTHRVGELRVGDLAIVACVSSAHRAAAFDACREIVERVKHELPVWKRQHTASGEANWVGIA